MEPWAVNEESWDFACAMYVAIDSPHIEMFQTLLEDRRLDMKEFGLAFVHAAVRDNNVRALRALLEHPHFDPSNDDNEMVKFAIDNNQMEIALVLLQDHRIDPGAMNVDHLTEIVHAKNVQLLRAFLQHPRVDPSTYFGRAWILSILTGQIEMIRVFLNDPRIWERVCFDTAFYCAIGFKKQDIALLLLNHHSHENGPFPFRRMSMAASGKNVEAVHMLLSHPRFRLENFGFDEIQSVCDPKLLVCCLARNMTQDPCIASVFGRYLMRTLDETTIANIARTMSFDEAQQRVDDRWPTFVQNISLIQAKMLHHLYAPGGSLWKQICEKYQDGMRFPDVESE